MLQCFCTFERFKLLWKFETLNTFIVISPLCECDSLVMHDLEQMLFELKLILLCFYSIKG